MLLVIPDSVSPIATRLLVDLITDFTIAAFECVLLPCEVNYHRV
jgi:hypothetical protein